MLMRRCFNLRGVAEIAWRRGVYVTTEAQCLGVWGFHVQIEVKVPWSILHRSVNISGDQCPWLGYMILPPGIRVDVDRLDDIENS